MSRRKQQTLDRRAVLQGFGTLAAATTAATIPLDEAQAYNPGADETRARYRETEHVKAFYRTNGYETLQK